MMIHSCVPHIVAFSIVVSTATLIALLCCARSSRKSHVRTAMANFPVEKTLDEYVALMQHKLNEFTDRYRMLHEVDHMLYKMSGFADSQDEMFRYVTSNEFHEIQKKS